jgi:iron complex outermembrane receptor protein
LPWWGLQLGCELQYDSRRQAVDGTSVDGYWLANVNLIATRLAKGLDVSLAIHNLFNQHYQHPGADTNWQTRLDQDGINARIKLDYRF